MNEDNVIPALEVRGLRKVFGGAVAIAHADFTVLPGEIHGLLGENGAGKSTLIKIVAGVYAPDAGEIDVAGARLATGHTPEVSVAAGVAVIHQDVGLVADMTVAENIALVVGYARRYGLIDWRGMRVRAEEVLATMGVELDPNALIADLPIAARAVVAIARALASNARLLILDEPTASLPAGEVTALFQILNNLKRQGLGIVYVSHRMDEVHEICDRATVMRDGVSVATVRLDEVDGKGLIRLIVGRDVQIDAQGDTAAPALGVDGYLVLDNVSCESAGPLTLSVGRGEIVGLTGLAGAGYTAVGEILYGIQRTRDGAITIGGEAFHPESPQTSLARGISFVPADRSASGVATRMTVRENLYLNPGPGHQIYRASRFIRPRAERREALVTMTEFDVRPRETEREVSTLSGGNSQKVLLAKWLSMSPDIVVLNEPTTGVDIGAREEIYNMVRRAAAAGATVLVASSDFEEIVRLCGRACVFARGRVVHELNGTELTIAAVTSAAGQSIERSAREG